MMQTNNNAIAFDDSLRLEVNNYQQQFNLAASARESETSRFQLKARSRSNKKAIASRNVRKERNQSALLPQLENNRYPSSGGAELDTNMLNFVKTSKKQMRDVIGQQQPQAKKFFDDGIANQGNAAADQAKNKGMMPTFSTSQMMARIRPSVQSHAPLVKQSMPSSNKMPELDAGLLQLNDEISEMAASTRGPKRLQQLAVGSNKLASAFMRDRPSLPVSANVSALISPRGLMPNPSKASLVTDIHNPSAMSQQETYTAAGRTNHSPTGNTTLAALGRELKHLSRYIDSREMQIRTELESTQKLDVILEQNKLLQELYIHSISQVRQKLPVTTQILSELVKRIAEGLHECFQVQERNFQKKVEIRNKKIESQKNEIVKLKDDFYEFKKNSTMDAYFKKYHDVVMRTGRREKDYLKELVQTVDDFLDSDPGQLKKMQVADERSVSKDAEPSGVDSLLMQLQIQQENRNQDLPVIQENPLTTVESEKSAVMNEFQKTLQREANQIRNVIEQHVKSQMGLQKPTADFSAQTLTYDRIKDIIMEETQAEIEEQIQKNIKEINDMKIGRLMSELNDMQKRFRSMKQKFTDLQKKTSGEPDANMLEEFKLKVSFFFKKKLGKKKAHILKEFNETILQIATQELPDEPDSPAIRGTNSSVRDDYGSQASPGLKRAVMGSNVSSASRISGENVTSPLFKQSIIAKAMSSHESLVLSISQSDKGDNDASRSIARIVSAEEPKMKVVDQRQEDSKSEQVKSEQASAEDAAGDQESEEAAEQVQTKSHPGASNEAEKPKQDALQEQTSVDQPSPAKAEEKKSSSPPPTTASPRKSASPAKEKAKTSAAAPSSPAKKGAQKASPKAASKSPLPAETSQDEAPPSKQPDEDVTAPPAEKDNRKELLNKLRASNKSTTSGIKNFQSADQLKSAATKASKVIEGLARIQASAEAASKIMKVNADEEPALIGKARDLLSRAFEQNQKLDAIRDTQKKILVTQDLHKQLAKVSKFLAAQKKGKLPDKEKIMSQQCNLDIASDKVASLPQKKELDQIGDVDKMVKAIEKELEDLYTIKFVKPAVVTSMTTPVVPFSTAPDTPVQGQPAHPVSAVSRDPVADAIAGIRIVKNQITESHEPLLDASNSNVLSEKEKKMVEKVQRLLSHMNEAMDWLTQRSAQDGKLAVSEPLTASERQESRHESHQQFGQSKTQMSATGSLKRLTQRQEAAETPKAQSEAIHWQVKDLTRSRETEGDVVQVESQLHNMDEASENEGAKRSTNRQTIKIDTKLGNIGEVNEIETDAGGNFVIESQMRKSDLTSPDAAIDLHQVDASIKVDKSSRIEVFRKTPIKISDQQASLAAARQEAKYRQVGTPQSRSSVGSPNKTANEAELDDVREQGGFPQRVSETQPIGKHNAQARAQYEEFADFDQEAQMNGGNVNLRRPKQQTSQNVKYLANQLRQSATETDYLKTTSQFGLESQKADLKSIAMIGNVKTQANPANDTTAFFNNLQQQVAQDQKNQHSTRKQEVYGGSSKNQGSVNHGATKMQLNQDLEKPNQFLNSQASSMVDHEYRHMLKPHNETIDGNQGADMPGHNLSAKKASLVQKQLQNAAARGQAPSALKISQKPYHLHLSNQVVHQNSPLNSDLGHMPMRRPVYQPNSVLMLTQETQTENRPLIKYLLTLINETIMKQLEQKSVRMTQDDFKDTVKVFSDAIPSVYKRIKDQSDTFFIDQQLGPQYTTAHMMDTEHEMLHQAHQAINMRYENNNRDLMQMIDRVYHQEQQTMQQSHQGGVQIVTRSRPPQKELSPSSSKKVLHNSPSHQRLQQSNTVQSLHHDASTQSLVQKSNEKVKKVPYLQLGDFSRYGSHTLELSQEVKTRVNLRQIGAAGGGFIGKPVRVVPIKDASSGYQPHQQPQY